MKMPRILLSALIASACAFATNSVAHAQTIITQWKFTAAAGAGDNTPAPTLGTGAASMLGMTNSYTYTNGATTLGTGATASGDVLATTGVANTSFNELVWRVRGVKAGSNTGTANNGWNLSAPEYSQGAEFDASTLGFQNISVSFDFYSTTQGVRDLQEQYTTDGSTWININAPVVAVSNDYFATTSPTNSISFSSITGANNDSSFGIRLVSAYDPAFGNNTYSAASSNNTSQTVYNNNSGNWRFGNITFEGSAIAVPEPGTTGMITGALALLAGLVAAKRRRKTSEGVAILPSPAQ